MIPSFWAWGVASSEHEEALQQALNETGREGEEEAVKEELWNKWKEAEAEEKYPSRAGERPDIIEKFEKQVGALWGISFLFGIVAGGLVWIPTGECPEFRV